MFLNKAPGLLLILVMAGFSGCHSVLKTEQPPEYYQKAEYIPTYSYINLPFEVEVTKLEQLINNQFSGLIYSDTSFEDNNHDNLKVKAWKTGDLHLTTEGNQLIYSVPLHVVIKKRIEIGPSLLNISDISEVSADLILKFRTRIALNPDWTVSTTTFSDGYQWLSAPTIKVGAMNIPVPMVSDIILEANQKDINHGIDKALQEYFDLRQTMKDIWKQIQAPIRITDIYPIWASIAPFELRATPVTSSFGTILFSAGIKARSELFYGIEPDFRIDDTLPNLKITSRLDNDFNLNLILDVPFSHINDIAQDQLSNRRFTEGKYTLVIKDVFLYGNGENLIVALNVEGSIRGTLYLSGKPYYDAAERVLSVADLDFDVRTKNVLLQSASWIFHQGFIKSVSPQLVFPIGDQLQVIRNSVQSFLDEKTKMGYFRISGNLDKLEIQNILITRSSVKAVFNLSGALKITMD